MPSEEELLLLFKESGVEFVEDAAKAVGELGDAMAVVNDAQQAAVDVLKEEGTVVEDLEAKIAKLKQELEALADAHKAGLITQERYKEETDKLVKGIAENETVLKRLTASQREQEKAEAETTRVAEAEIAARLKAYQQEEAAKQREAEAIQKAADEEVAALAKITQALKQLEIEEEQEQLAAIALAEKHYQMMTAAEAAAGTGDGEAGAGGMAGLAANVMKAEKVMAGLAGGTGFGRMGGMLEGITTALGLAGGTGMAAGGLIFAFEALIPKIQAFMDKMDGAAEATKRATEALKIYQAEVKKEEEAPTEDEEKAEKVVKELLKGKGAQEVRQGIEQNLVQGGIGLTAEQKAGQYLDPETGQMTRFSPEEMEQFGDRSRAAAQARAGQLMLELRRGAPGAIAAVQGLSHVPESFRTRLGQTTPEAIEAAQRQDQQGKADSEWADTTYAKQAAATKEGAEIDIQLDKARKDKLKHKADDYDAAMKFAADYKTELDKAAEHQAKQAKTKAEHATKAARTKAEHDARLNTPEAQTAREMKAQGQAVMNEERAQNQYRADMGASPFDPSELEQIKHKAMQHMPEARRRGISIGQLVAMMMAEQANEIEQGMMQGLGQQDRSRQNINPRGGH